MIGSLNIRDGVLETVSLRTPSVPESRPVWEKTGPRPGRLACSLLLLHWAVQVSHALEFTPPALQRTVALRWVDHLEALLG